MAESWFLYAAAAAYLAATLAAVAATLRGEGRMAPALGLLAAALSLHSLAIALRWIRLGHGPYVDLFEILSSNVWSLHLVLFVVVLALPRTRGGLAPALGALSVLVLWMLAAPVRDTQVPVTYDTIWLPIHMVLGKLFLGLTVAALGLALVILARRLGGWRLSVAPPTAQAGAIAHRVMTVAIAFETMMLVAGAAWARDAWGRYWAWDPLESWAFLTWLAALAYLHWQTQNRDREAAAAAMILGVYVLAFFTFFGVPFLSTAPHKGAV